MSARSPESPRSTHEARRGEHQTTGGAEPTPAEHDEEARLFYERLEQSGKLVDVDANTDLSALPPDVTHIRHPDGTIERIGYAAF